MKKAELSLLFGLILSMAVGSVTAFSQQCALLRGDVLRLHILAASDTEYDQQVKLQVRDALLREGALLFAAAETRQQAQRLAEAHLPQLQAAAEAVLRQRGVSYGVQASVGPAWFSTRSYGSVTLPAGEYTALRIVLGEGTGQNWWCVMYPQLCLPAAVPREERLTAEEWELVNTPVRLEPRFALLEWMQRLRQ